MSSWDELKRQVEELLAERGELPAANQSRDGLMVSGDYVKLQEVAEKANKIAIDDVLADSVNPVQNKVVTSRLDGLNSSLVSLDASITEAADSKGNPNTYSGMQKLIDQLESDITIFEETIDWIRGEACSPIGPPPA